MSNSNTTFKPVVKQSENPENMTPSFLLSEVASSTRIIYFGLNFAYTKVKKKGLLNRIRQKTHSMDLDISCVLFDKKLQPIETIWFKELRDSKQSIRHQGDSLNGKDRSDLAEVDRNTDVETIEMQLEDVSAAVEHITLILSSYGGYPLNNVNRGQINIIDDEGNELYHMDLTKLDFNNPATHVATLSREFDDWRLNLLNLPLKSSHMQRMIKQIQSELTQSTAL